MDVFSNPITSQITSIVVAAVCGWLSAQATRLRKRDAALFEGMKAVLRRELVDDFETYVVDGRPLSLERKREIDECFAAYAALGGNGTAAQMYERLKTLEVKV